MQSGDRWLMPLRSLGWTAWDWSMTQQQVCVGKHKFSIPAEIDIHRMHAWPMYKIKPAYLSNMLLSMAMHLELMVSLSGLKRDFIPMWHCEDTRSEWRGTVLCRHPCTWYDTHTITSVKCFSHPGHYECCIILSITWSRQSNMIFSTKDSKRLS